MTVLARKIKSSPALTLYLIVGAVIMGAAFLVLPIGVFTRTPELLTNPYMWGAVLIGMLFFGSFGYFLFLRPYFQFRKTPQIQAETDGTYLYIYGKKEAKIPLAQMEGTYLDASCPYMRSHEFLVHLFSEQYGTVIIEVPKQGKYKLPFVADARRVPDLILSWIQGAL